MVLSGVICEKIMFFSPMIMLGKKLWCDYVRNDSVGITATVNSKTSLPQLRYAFCFCFF